MNTSSEMRRKRQVSRAKQKAKISEPDVRPPEPVKAPREASRPVLAGSGGSNAHYSASSVRHHGGAAAAHNPAKAEV